MMRRRLTSSATILLLLTLAACRARQPAPPATPPPAGSPLAQIQVGMTEIDVRKALGEPTSSRDYITGKAFIPYYYGPDTARSAWTYAGQGEVVFSRNRYTGGLKVIQVIYDPSK